VVVSASRRRILRNNNNNNGNEPTATAAAIVEEDPNFDRKLDLITAGGHDFIKNHLLTKITRQNCSIIVDYILAMQTEVNPSPRYRVDTIFKLKQLAEFHNAKSFRDMTRQDVLDFLDNLRKPESVDPMHKWIGTHETSRIILLHFFKWLYYPDFSPARKRPKPAIMDNIAKLKRREISTYSSSSVSKVVVAFIQIRLKGSGRSSLTPIIGSMDPAVVGGGCCCSFIFSSSTIAVAKK
jgi:hypothetical protein